MADKAITAPENLESCPAVTLLRRFAAARDEPAFAELVRRHGRLVWGVCRRRLARREDAEDAFQATFLILAAKAGSIRRGESLAGWLHRAACRAAIRVASAPPGRGAEDRPAPGLDALADLARREAAVALDEELVRLPRRYRDALVLFHLEELERRDVADRLGISEPAAKALLARGRSLLRSRLARRGLAIPMLLPFAADPLPAEAAATACRLASSFAGSGLTPLDLFPSPFKGWSAMFSSMSGKSIAAGIAGAVGLTVFLSTRDPATAGTDRPGVDQRVADTVIDGGPERPFGEIQLAEGTTAAPAGEAAEPSGKEKGSAKTSVTGLPDRASKLIPPAEKKIWAQLDKETRVEFPGIPMSDALKFLGTLHEVNLIIDEKALVEAGINVDDKISVVLSAVSLRSALDVILQPAGLAYTVKDEVLQVTTAEKAAREIDVRAYDLAPLLGDQPAEESNLAESITRLLETRGGSSSPPPTPQIVAYKDRLLVSASWADQERVREILRLMAAGR